MLFAAIAGPSCAEAVRVETAAAPAGLEIPPLAVTATGIPGAGAVVQAGSNRAVFLAALADGSVAQVQVENGVDGLAPAGSVTLMPGIDRAAAESNNPGRRVAGGNGLQLRLHAQRLHHRRARESHLVLDLSDDGTVFHATARSLTSDKLDLPVDITPAVVEVGTRNFASNTTLGSGRTCTSSIAATTPSCA